MLANFMLQHDIHNSKLAHLVERKYDTKIANSGMIFNNMKTTEFGTYVLYPLHQFQQVFNCPLYLSFTGAVYFLLSCDARLCDIT